MDAFDKLNRVLKKTTQLKFSHRTGIHQSQLSLMSRRLKAPTLEQIPALNVELGTTFEEWARAAAAVKKKRAGEAA